MKWFLKVLKQYDDFSGRARRKEFWMFFLFFHIFAVVAAILDNLLGLTFTSLSYGWTYSRLILSITELAVSVGWIYSIYSLLLIVPVLAVSVRRLHDIGKSGWFILLGFIPVVGTIILFIWSCFDSQPGENKWGANPKEEIMS